MSFCIASRVGTSTLPPMWPHFLGGGELVLEVDAGRACFDHRLHELEGVERAAEAGLRVGDDGEHAVDLDRSLRECCDLVGAQQGVVDAFDDLRDTELTG